MEMNNIYRVRSIARKNFTLTETARKLLVIPSVMLSSFSISKGQYKMEFLFHDSQIDDVSKVILQEVNFCYLFQRIGRLAQESIYYGGIISLVVQLNYKDNILYMLTVYEFNSICIYHGFYPVNCM